MSGGGNKGGSTLKNGRRGRHHSKRVQKDGERAEKVHAKESGWGIAKERTWTSFFLNFKGDPI